MKFYNVDNRGKFWLQRGTSLPAGTGADDEGRAFYKTDVNTLYLNDGGTWNALSGAYVDVPLNTILLVESNVALTGYSLQTDKDDMTVYITKGSGAGGETGGTDKSGGTWTQPGHTHTGGSVALTVAQLAQHRHSYVSPSGNYGCGSGPDPISLPNTSRNTGYAGSGSTHSHGATSSGATSSSWRPEGRNFTRQKRV